VSASPVLRQRPIREASSIHPCDDFSHHVKLSPWHRLTTLPCYSRLVSVFSDIIVKDGDLDETMGSHIATSYAEYGGWNYVQGGMHTQRAGTCFRVDTKPEIEGLTGSRPNVSKRSRPLSTCCSPKGLGVNDGLNYNVPLLGGNRPPNCIVSPEACQVQRS
jgi:hypothetical protein